MSTFDILLKKYKRLAAILRDQPREKGPRSPPRQEMNRMQQRKDTRRRREVQHEHPSVAPNVSRATNHHTRANLAFCPLFPLMAPYVDQPMS
jgi:hypothetical protein